MSELTFKVGRFSALIVSLVITRLIFFVLSHNAYADSRSFSFSQWRGDLTSESLSFQHTDQLWIEELPPNALVVSLYPQKISVQILNWVGAGGSLFLTLNHATAEEARELLTALDLKVHPQSTAENIEVSGAWPFPMAYQKSTQGLNHLLTPWLTWRPLTFTEGVSWFKGEISPLAIDEKGRSLGYRVRYGQGTFTLFGDGDGLSDQMRVIPENRRFAQSVMWLISHPKRSGEQAETPQGLTEVFFVTPGGRVLSVIEEESFSHKIKAMIQGLKSWWAKSQLRHFNLYTHLRYALSGLMIFFLWILHRLTRSGDWKRRVILRRK